MEKTEEEDCFLLEVEINVCVFNCLLLFVLNILRRKYNGNWKRNQFKQDKHNGHWTNLSEDTGKNSCQCCVLSLNAATCLSVCMSAGNVKLFFI